MIKILTNTTNSNYTGHIRYCKIGYFYVFNVILVSLINW